MSLFIGLDDGAQQALSGGGLVVETGASRAPKGFFRNPNSPENFYATTALEGDLYPLNNGFYRTGANGLNLIEGRVYASGKGAWRTTPGGVTVTWGEAPPFP